MTMRSLIFLLLSISSAWSLNVEKQGAHQISKNAEGRIIGGWIAPDAFYPFMAAIWATTNLGRYFCGGAIIDSQWILTSGDCVLDAVEFRIQLGSNSLSNSSDINRVNITATVSVAHPDFNPNTLVNNIGLINLPEPLNYNDYVNAIALPTSVLPDETLLMSTGWGQIDDQNSGPVDDLYQVGLITLPIDYCRRTYGDQIVDSMVCAVGAYNEGTCIGDIGGPLFQYIGDLKVHVGIASFLSGNGCESLDPSGYERTFEHLDWIKSETNIP